MIDQTFIDQFKPRSIEHNTVCITEGTYLSATHLGIAMFVAKVDEGRETGLNHVTVVVQLAAPPILCVSIGPLEKGGEVVECDVIWDSSPPLG